MKKHIKTIVAVGALIVASATAQAQGTFNFFTAGPVVSYAGSPLDSSYTGQIYGGLAGSDPSTWAYLGNSATFFENAGNGTGVINGGVETTSLAGQADVDLVLRVWDNASGSYDAALIGGISGESGVFSVKLGGGSPPSPPPSVNGFASFQATMAVVPEPSVILLGLAGAGMLWFRRKK